MDDAALTQFSINFSHGDLLLTCTNCWWSNEVSGVPRLSTLIFKARAHFQICHPEEKSHG